MIYTLKSSKIEGKSMHPMQKLSGKYFASTTAIEKK